MGGAAVLVSITVAVLGVAMWTVIRVARRPRRRRRPAWRPMFRRPPRRRVRTDVPHALYYYRHAVRPGARYYGVSNEPPVRHARHLVDPDDQWWMVDTTYEMVIVAWYPDRDTAFAAERAAIRGACARGEDIANRVHVPRSYRPSRMH